MNMVLFISNSKIFWRWACMYQKLQDEFDMYWSFKHTWNWWWAQSEFYYKRIGQRFKYILISSVVKSLCLSLSKSQKSYNFEINFTKFFVFWSFRIFTRTHLCLIGTLSRIRRLKIELTSHETEATTKFIWPRLNSRSWATSIPMFGSVLWTFRSVQYHEK